MVEFDVGGRQIGKTTRILQWMVERNDPHSICVCHNEHEVKRLRNLIKDKRLPLEESQFISVNNKNVLRGRSSVLAVDNLDMMLYYLFGATVERVTATGINLAKVVE